MRHGTKPAAPTARRLHRTFNTINMIVPPRPQPEADRGFGTCIYRHTI